MEFIIQLEEKMLSIEDHPKANKQDLNSVRNLSSLYMMVCIGKKLYCYITEGEFVTGNTPRCNFLLSSRF